MSNYKIRENKTCLNCGKFVADHFCPYCGQANTEFRHSFIYLLKHFVSDLLHYDSSFWTTIKLLLFSPAALSKKYMQGKHKSYVDPIKLYIFISFLAFFIPGFLPSKAEKDNHSIQEANINIDITIDSPQIKTTNKNTKEITTYKVDNIAQLDSLAKIKEISLSEYYSTKLKLKVQKIKSKEQQEKVNEFILHNLSKVLFIYMPMFAFWLWLFNDKKKFLYFDSGIFTLHYFSFLLLSVTIYIMLSAIFVWLNLPEIFSSLTGTAIFCYAIFYFFRANRLFYGNKRWIANTKAFGILAIDSVLIIIILLLFALLAMYMV